jgi:hypothetical protein
MSVQRFCTCEEKSFFWEVPIGPCAYWDCIDGTEVADNVLQDLKWQRTPLSCVVLSEISPQHSLLPPLIPSRRARALRLRTQA